MKKNKTTKIAKEKVQLELVIDLLDEARKYSSNIDYSNLMRPGKLYEIPGFLNGTEEDVIHLKNVMNLFDKLEATIEYGLRGLWLPYPTTQAAIPGHWSTALPYSLFNSEISDLDQARRIRLLDRTFCPRPFLKPPENTISLISINKTSWISHHDYRLAMFVKLQRIDYLANELFLQHFESIHRNPRIHALLESHVTVEVPVFFINNNLYMPLRNSFFYLQNFVNSCILVKDE